MSFVIFVFSFLLTCRSRPGPTLERFVRPVLVLLVLRRHVLLSVVAFTLPLSLIALLVFSDFGTTHYSVFHLVSVAVWGQLLFEGATVIRRKAWKTLLPATP